MTEKQSYWIADVAGNRALVQGADQRDWFTKVQGWSESDEPGLNDQVHVVNENPEIQPGRLPYGAVPHWAGLGWTPGPPPGEGAPEVPAAAPVAPQKTPAAAGGSKDKE